MAGTHDAAPLGYCILPVASSASIPRTPNDRKQADWRGRNMGPSRRLRLQLARQGGQSPWCRSQISLILRAAETSRSQNPHSGQAFSRSVDHLSASFSRFEKLPVKHGY
jgi:hypothetical protein